MSDFLIALSFLLAFHRGVWAWTVAHLKVGFGWISHVTGFDRRFNRSRIQDWERKKLESFRKGKSPTLHTSSEEFDDEKLGAYDSSDDDDDDDDEYIRGFFFCLQSTQEIPRLARLAMAILTEIFAIYPWP